MSDDDDDGTCNDMVLGINVVFCWENIGSACRWHFSTSLRFVSVRQITSSSAGTALSRSSWKCRRCGTEINKRWSLEGSYMSSYENKNSMNYETRRFNVANRRIPIVLDSESTHPVHEHGIYYFKIRHNFVLSSIRETQQNMDKGTWRIQTSSLYMSWNNYPL